MNERPPAALDAEELPHGWARLLVESRRPDAVRNLPAAGWLVVATVCVGAFMGQLDASIVTLAFPTLKAHFGVSVGAVEWVALGYLLVLVAVVTAVGRLADMFGRKQLYIYGFLLFAASSLACGLSPDLGTLIGSRVVQAVGAALLQANSVALIATALPPDRLGRGIGVQGAAQAVGLALGPTIGGLLIGLAGWRWIFFVNVPVGLLGAVAGRFLLPRSRQLSPRTRFDWVGLAGFVPAVSALLLAFSFAERSGFGSAPVVGLLAGCLAAGVAFVGWEHRAGQPLLDLRLFRRPGFAVGIASGLLGYLVLFGVLFIVPFFLERAQGATPARAGLLLTGLPLALAVVAPPAGRLADRLGARAPTVVGLSVCAAALFGLALAHDSDGELAGLLATAGVGLGLFLPANNSGIMAAAPRRQSGVAGGVLT